MAAFSSCRVAVVLFFAFVVGCQRKPDPPGFLGCKLTYLRLEEDGVHVKIGIVPPALGVRPAASFDLELLAQNIVANVRCKASAKVERAAYASDTEIVLGLGRHDECAGEPPEGNYMAVRGSLTAEGTTFPFTCANEPDVHVPALWGGHDPTAQPKPRPSAAVPTDPRPVVVIDVKDALRFPNGKVDEAPAPIRIYARLPDAWIANGALTPKAKTTVLAKLYGGPDWEKGNVDGSRYIVRSFTARSLTPAEIAQSVWIDRPAESVTSHTWFYETDANGVLQTRGPDFGPRHELPPAGHLDGH